MALTTRTCFTIKGYDQFARDVAYKIGASNDQRRACCGDLRQLQTSTKFEGSNASDKTGHVFFDTLAILKGQNRGPEFYNTKWLEQNVMASTNDLDACSRYYDTLTFMDANRCMWGIDGYDEDDEQMDGTMLKFALPQNTRAPAKLQRPHVSEEVPYLYYPEFIKRRKRKLSDLEGDHAQAELTVFNKDFLSNYFGSILRDGVATVSPHGTTVSCSQPSYTNRKRQRRLATSFETEKQIAHITEAVNDVQPSDTIAATELLLNLDLKTYVLKSTEPLAVDTGEEPTMMTCGSIIQVTRNRSEVIVECPNAGDDLKATYEKLKQNGVMGITVSKFRNGVAAFIIKDYNKNLKFDGAVTKALEHGRRSNETVVTQLLKFTSATQRYSDMKLEKKPVDVEMPDFAETCEQLEAVDVASFRELHANALKARRYKRLTPLQEAILTYTTDLKDWLVCKEDAESMVFHMDNPGPHFLDNFKRSVVLNLRGLHFETSTGIMTTTLKDAISKPQAPGKPPLLYSKTMIFVGKASTGKSELIHGLCREACQRRKKDKYGMSASIDPYGLMTKSGKIKELGAIGLYDFKLKSKINNRLSREEAKGLLYVKERAHIGARYHQAVFYEFVPRFWAINIGHDDNGEDDPSEWFRTEHLDGLSMLVCEDDEGLTKANAHDQAIARRAVIFVIDECLYEDNAQGATDAVACARWEEDKLNATPLD